MSISRVNANILMASEDIIVHQTNGLGVMGAGLALQVKKKYPLVFQTYRTFCKNHDKPTDLLGKNLLLTADGSDLIYHKKGSGVKIISNLFGQAYIGRDKCHTDLAAVKTSLRHLRLFAEYRGLSIAMPEGMGCNLGGGRWEDYLAIIEDVFDGYPVTLYNYK